MAHNAANRDSFAFTLPGTAYPSTSALEWYATGNGMIEAKFENEGNMQYNPPQSSHDYWAKFQESDDGAAWTDIAGSEVNIVPKGTSTRSFQVGKRYLRLIGFGNAAGQVIISWDGLDGLQLREF